MKKLLLLGALAATALTSMAFVDDYAYPTFPVEGHDFTGYTLKNKWICARNYEGSYDTKAKYASIQARTACVYIVDGVEKIISGAAIDQTDGTRNAAINVWDFKTGAYEGQIELTLDGKPINGTLPANQVGVDDFGHLWFMSYYASIYNKEYGASKLKIYYLPDYKTGEAKLAGEFSVTEEQAEQNGRIDYGDILGDILREQAGCTYVAALADPGATDVVGFACEQGSDNWEGAFDDYIIMSCSDTYPADQTKWGTAPVARIVKNDDYVMEMLYVDGFTTCPALYTTDASMIDSFAAATQLAPATGTNGVAELTLNDDPFLIYSLAQYNEGPGNQASIAMLGEGMAFEGMQKMWDFPEKGLGTTSDGVRVHSFHAVKYTDKNGLEGAYILNFKCYNGLGVYVLAPEGWEDPNPSNEDGGVNDIFTDDNNAPVEYYNLQGVRIANPAAGQVVIARQGSKAAKQLVK